MSETFSHVLLNKLLLIIFRETSDKFYVFIINSIYSCSDMWFWWNWLSNVRDYSKEKSFWLLVFVVFTQYGGNPRPRPHPSWVRSFWANVIPVAPLFFPVCWGNLMDLNQNSNLLVAFLFHSSCFLAVADPTCTPLI